MIDRAIVLLRDRLNAHLRDISGDDGDSTEDRVVLVDGDQLEPVAFMSGAVSALLVNVEVDHSLPQADPFRRSLPDGTVIPVSPEIRLNLSVLFVARFKQYEHGLARLSAIIEYFQNHRFFDHTNSADLDPRLERLVVEMVTLSFGEQNQVWGSLRTAYLPSVLYRVRLLTFAEADTTPGPKITEILTSVTQ